MLFLKGRDLAVLLFSWISWVCTTSYLFFRFILIFQCVNTIGPGSAHTYYILYLRSTIRVCRFSGERGEVERWQERKACYLLLDKKILVSLSRYLHPDFVRRYLPLYKNKGMAVACFYFQLERKRLRVCLRRCFDFNTTAPLRAQPGNAVWVWPCDWFLFVCMGFFHHCSF